MPGEPNYTLSNALEQYNRDPVFTQTMWHIQPTGGGANAPYWEQLKDMQIYGQNFEAPARTNEFVSVAYRGWEIPTPTVPKMTQEHSMTVNCDVQQRLRKLFMDSMNATLEADGIEAGFPSFAADRRPTAGIGSQRLTLTLLGSDYQTEIVSYIFHGVRVSEVGTMSLSNTDGGIATFSVNFKSVYWSFGKGQILNVPHAAP